MLRCAQDDKPIDCKRPGWPSEGRLRKTDSMGGGSFNGDAEFNGFSYGGLWTAMRCLTLCRPARALSRAEGQPTRRWNADCASVSLPSYMRRCARLTELGISPSVRSQETAGCRGGGGVSVLASTCGWGIGWVRGGLADLGVGVTSGGACGATGADPRGAAG